MSKPPESSADLERKTPALHEEGIGDQGVLIRALRHDIEERKLVEAALRRGEQRLRDYFDLSLLGVAITSPEKDWVEINDTFCEMLGYSREELVRMTWPELTHPEDLVKDVALFDRILAGELDSYEIDKRYIRRDGTMVHTLLSVKAVRRPDRSVDYFAAFVLDMTSRMEAEQRLHASERKLAAHFKSTPLGVIEWTCDLRVSAWNPGASRIFGYTEAEALGLPLTAFVPEQARPLVEGALRALLAGASGDRSVNENLTKDGRTISCEWFNSALIDESGTCSGISTMVQDVTSRVRAEAELRAHVATIERQREAIWALSAPLLQVWDGVIALPLIGLLDSARASVLMERLLARIGETRSHHAILDLTGVDMVDSAVAKNLQDLLQAMKLLGTRALVTGIHPAVARTMVAIGLDLPGVIIRSTMQDALKLCIEEEGSPQPRRAASDR